jgi:hypothetical protein
MVCVCANDAFSIIIVLGVGCMCVDGCVCVHLFVYAFYCVSA